MQHDEIFFIESVEFDVGASASAGVDGQFRIRGRALGMSFDKKLTLNIRKLGSVLPDALKSVMDDAITDKVPTARDTVQQVNVENGTTRRLLAALADLPPSTPTKFVTDDVEELLTGHVAASALPSGSGRVFFSPGRGNVPPAASICAAIPLLALPGTHFINLSKTVVDADVVQCIFDRVASDVASISVVSVALSFDGLAGATSERVLPMPPASAGPGRATYSLSLANNDYTGSITAAFAAESVVSLDLSNNKLTGNPYALNGAPRLRTLDLSGNALVATPLDGAAGSLGGLLSSMRRVLFVDVGLNRFDTTAVLPHSLMPAAAPDYVQGVVRVAWPIEQFCSACPMARNIDCALAACRNATRVVDFQNAVVGLLQRAVGAAAPATGATAAWAAALAAADVDVIRIDDRHVNNATLASRATIVTFRIDLRSPSGAAPAAATASTWTASAQAAPAM
jgi:hypothetical protein